MAKTAPIPTGVAQAQPHRLRAGAILAVMAFAFVVAIAAMGVDWSEGPAMVLGELIGLAAPVVVIGATALALYSIWRRNTGH